MRIPGKRVITQPVLQEYYQQNDIHHLQNPVYDRVTIERKVPLVTPYAQKVPVLRKIPVPIPSREKNDGTIIRYLEYNAYISTLSGNDSSHHVSEEELQKRKGGKRGGKYKSTNRYNAWGDEANWIQ